MDLFKLLGTIAIDNSEANSALSETSANARNTADVVSSSTGTIRNSNGSAGTSWSSLKARVAEYKAEGLTTSQAWRQATQDMHSSTETASGGMVSAFTRIGAAVATYLSVTAIKNFGLSCIQAAADANAASSQFTQVFGELESSASTSLSGIADTAGISENRLKGSFTQIAAFAKTTGMDTEAALGLSERAMIAVADSAAFYDRSIEETTESLQSFLKGNYENDAALGLSCTETTRNAAANKLYGKSFNELSESQKQLALLQMVEDANKASGALGQAARESDTWTNVTGNLKQAWTDFQAVIGSTILPAAVGVVKSMVGALESWTEKLPALIEWCKEHETTMQIIGVALGTITAAIGAYVISLNAAAIKTAALTAATTAWGSVMAFVTSPVTLTVAAIGALVAAVVIAYREFDWFRAAVDRMKDGLVNAYNAMKDAAIAVKDRIVAAWDEISARCEPLITAIKDNLTGAFNDLKNAGQALKDRFDELREKFQPVIDILSGALSSAVSSVSNWFDKLTTKIGDLATGALEWLNEKITAAREAFNQFADFAGRLWDNLDPLVTLIRDNLVASLENLKEPIQTVKDALGAVGDTVMNDLLPALRDALMPLWEALKPILTAVAGIIGGSLATNFAVLTGIINGVVSAIDGFVRTLSGVIEVVANVFNLIVGIITGDGEKIKEAVAGIKDGIVDVFGGLWDAVSGFVKGFVDGVVGFFKGLWDTLVGHSIVPDIIDGIVNCFAGLWKAVSGFIKGFTDNVTKFFSGLKDKVVETAGKLKDEVSERFNQLKDKVSSAASTAKDKVVSSWNTLKDKTTSVYNSAKDVASNAWNSLKDKVSTAATSAKDKVSSAWTSLKDKTSSLYNSARDTAASAWNSLKDKVSSAANSTRDKASAAWSTLKDKTSSLFNSAKDAASSAFSALKSKITGDADGAENTVGSKFSSLKNKVSNAVNGAKDVVSSTFSSIKSSISSGAEGALSSVSSKFGSIKSKISDIMGSAKSAVSSAIDNIKSKFNFSWSLPSLKLPHVSISGKFSLNPLSVPKFGISWYNRAMDSAMILNNPTIFGYSTKTGKYLGGGESGNEVVAGESHLMELIGDVVESRTNTHSERIVMLLTRLLDVISGDNRELIRAVLAGQTIVLNNREFARAVREYA